MRRRRNLVTTEFCDQRYHRPMSDTSPIGPFPGPSPPGPTAPPTGAPWPSAPAVSSPRPSRWPAFAALAVGLVALAVSIGAWLRPAPDRGSASAEPSFTFAEEQSAEAKTKVCEAYSIVKDAVVINTHRTNPVADDQIGALTTGLYAEVALYEGGDYLLDRLAAEPATPVELAAPLKSLGDALKKLSIVDLTLESDAARIPLKKEVDDGINRIDGLCK